MSGKQTTERADAIERVRRRVRIDLEPTEPDTAKGEHIAYDVSVAVLGQVGRWARAAEGRGEVVWTDGRAAATPAAGRGAASIITALRETVPVTEELLTAFYADGHGDGTIGLFR